MITSDDRKIVLNDEDATLRFGRRLGEQCRGGDVIYLSGRLGAGKTTFCRGLLSAFGHSGPVKSPTYTLVEAYNCGEIICYHFDLYRVGNSEELEYMGIREYFDNDSISVIEWPERGEGAIASADLQLRFDVSGTGRIVFASSLSERGEHCIEKLFQDPLSAL